MVVTIGGGWLFTPARLNVVSDGGSNNLVCDLGSLADQIDYGLRLGNVDRVTRSNLNDSRSRPPGHGTLSGRRNHPVLRCQEVPARFGLPGRLPNRALKRLNTPRDLTVRHERRQLRIDIAGKGG